MIRDSRVFLFVHPQPLLSRLQLEGEYLELKLFLIDQVITNVAALEQKWRELIQLILHALDCLLVLERLKPSMNLHVLFENDLEAIVLLGFEGFLTQ